MCKSLSIFIFVFTALSAMGFSQVQVQPQKPPEEPPPVLFVPKDYHYNARGRRDPFVNPVPKPVQPVQATGGAPPAPPQCPAGLKGVLVAQATIAGVVTSKEPSMNIVVIAGPGGKTYFARVGDALCDAVVKSIMLDAITFTVTTQGNTDQKENREIVRKVRPAPGENK
jgi:hypothetical protein